MILVRIDKKTVMAIGRDPELVDEAQHLYVVRGKLERCTVYKDNLFLRGSGRVTGKSERPATAEDIRALIGKAAIRVWKELTTWDRQTRFSLTPATILVATSYDQISLLNDSPPASSFVITLKGEHLSYWEREDRDGAALEDDEKAALALKRLLSYKG